MLGFGHTVDLDFKCDVAIDCPSCDASQLQLHWARKRLALLGIATVSRGEGFFFKCRHCPCNTLYGPIEPGVAIELQEGGNYDNTPTVSFRT